MKKFFPTIKTNNLSKNMLIQPYFIDEKISDKKLIKGLGDNYSWSSKKINKAIERDLKKGITNFLLFIVPVSKQKIPEDFSFHYQVIRNIKKQFAKDIVLLIDTCLCSITPDGHCGVTNYKTIDLQQTHYSLGVAANTYLEAGADIIAPSDMMKNTTKYLKKTLGVNNFHDSTIMSYSSKFKSNFYISGWRDRSN